MARCHPDAGGEHELFIWAHAVREMVCGEDLASQRRVPPRSEPEPASPAPKEPPPSVPFEYATPGFAALTGKALALAEELPKPYALLWRILEDCGTSYVEPYRSQQERGEWYRIAESIPLSMRHAGHIFSRLQKAAA